MTPIEGCSYVFSTNGRTPVSGFSKSKAKLDSLMTVLGWRLYDLRRTAATGMAGLGAPPHIVEAALSYVSGGKAGAAGTYNVEAYMEEGRSHAEIYSADQGAS